MAELMLFLIAAEEIENEEERQTLRVLRRNLRDTSNPFELPDVCFKAQFRLTKVLVSDLIRLLEPLSLNYERREVSHAIPFYLKMLAALNFYGHGCYQKQIGNSFIHVMTQASVSRSLREITDLIVTYIMPEEIKFPVSEADKLTVKVGFLQKLKMSGVVGAVDGCHVSIIAPPKLDPLYPGDVYINRKKYHSINVEVVSDSDMLVLAANARYPGSVHDSAIWTSSKVRQSMSASHAQGNKNSWLIGDSGYPLEPWIFTPVRNPEVDSPEARFNKIHKSTRNVVERLLGVAKSRFRCLLRHRVLHYTPPVAGKIIYAVLALHNICIKNNLPEVPLLSDDEDSSDSETEDEGLHRNTLQAGRLARQQYIDRHCQ